MPKHRKMRLKVHGKQTQARTTESYELYSEIEKRNRLMEAFYKAQLNFPEEEWDKFMAFCRRDLPSTFRITGVRGHADDLLRYLKDGYLSRLQKHLFDLDNLEEKPGKVPDDCNPPERPSPRDVDASHDKEEDFCLEPIKWYPNELAWNSNLSRRFIRHSEVLHSLHRFLVEDSECGAICRQEAVSMIPPLLLDVQPHHMVLDMCAAPGSKTAQIIEMMHADANVVPTGAVIANDADPKRCYMLTHQTKRLNSPAFVITNHDASIYPKLFIENRTTGVIENLRFDRVLCDVPCSGDGTLRKNPLIWRRWSSHLGVGLHRLQLRIAIRGLELTAVGGRLVYSTCSFNPIENEAVVATILLHSEGAVELVDCSACLPELVRSPGLQSWKVFSKAGVEYKTFADVNCPRKEGFKRTMFPPPADTVESLQLNRCLRIYPHLQNTGGFFVAVFSKKDHLPWQKTTNDSDRKRHANLPWEPSQQSTNARSAPGMTVPKAEEAVEIVIDEEQTVAMDGDYETEEAAVCGATAVDAGAAPIGSLSDGNENLAGSPPNKKRKPASFKECPYVFLDDADEDLRSLRTFYAISSELKSYLFMVRREIEGLKRNFYLVTDAVHNIVSNNASNLKVINTGLRVIARSGFKAGVTGDNSSIYRLTQDGICVLHRYLGKRIVAISREDMVLLLTEGDTQKEKLCAETIELLKDIDMGCIVWNYKASRSVAPVDLSADVWMCGHHGRQVIQCMLSKEERKHFLRLLRVQIPDKLLDKKKGASWDDGVMQRCDDRVETSHAEPVGEALH